MNLNEAQKRAAEFNGRHLLVLAGAGTGKTRTIIARAAYLIRKGVSPRKIQILTFTKRAAHEIVTRVKAEISTSEANFLRGSTFHSWCNELLTRYPNVFGPKSFTVIDEDDQLSIMRLMCGKFEEQFTFIRLKPRSLVDLYSFARNTKKNLTETLRIKLFYGDKEEDANEKIAQIKPHIEKILKGYEEKKRERKYFDYDDILQVVAYSLATNEKARELIRNKYEHVLVDEMQDTNPLQWDLLNPIQNLCHLFCVGDDAQSIYGFRGADFKNIHLFKERVKNAEVYKLEDNYRSTQEILDVSNWLIEQSPLEYNKKLKADRGAGEMPVILNVEDEWEEANWISDRIIENFTKKNKTYSDHLVLSRSSYYTRQLQVVFIEKKIPYVTYGGRKFMESAHIKDVISALRVVNNMQDEIAWMRFLTLWKGVGDTIASKYVNHLLQYQEIEECIEWFKELEQVNKKIYVASILKEIADQRGNVEEAAKAAYNGLKERLAENYLEDWDQKRRPDFPILITLASKYATIGEFITESILDASTTVANSPTLAQTELQPSQKKDVVIISTIHSAKGLEAEICYVLNVSPGAFPSAMSLHDEEEVEEERRLLYVAMTRAKNELYLTRNKFSAFAQAPVIAGSEQSKKTTSYFLNSLPDNLAIQDTPRGEFSDESTEETEDDNTFTFGMDFS